MLADATQNQSYLDLGHKSEEFYYNQLRNSQGDLLDGRNAHNCISPSEVTGPTNAVGTIIEGLAIVFALSKRDNTSTNLEEILYKAVSNTRWYNAEGILAVDDDIQADAQLVGQYVVRGISAIYSRNISLQPSIRSYIQQYLAVQVRSFVTCSWHTDRSPGEYNAVLRNARGQGADSNIYGASWTREHQLVSGFSFEQQTNVLSILVAAITIHNDTIPAGGEGPKESSEPSASPHATRPPTSIIVGVAVGVTVVLFSVIFVIWLICRGNFRRTRSTDGGSSAQPSAHSRIDAFVATSGNNNAKSGGHKAGKLSPDDAIAQTHLKGAQKFQLADGDATSNTVQRGVESQSDNSISTADLVRVLNRRLQGRERRQDELPPDYVSEDHPSRDDYAPGQKRVVLEQC
ncbi:hypothetical protein PM082_002797 [Marasmius tenuissimus]|nr:hypothetical protein PM082_002797 [Marasmius tenuissimus]